MNNSGKAGTSPASSSESALDAREMSAAYAESVYNGSLISWRYWVEHMPHLSAADAARLICALDPDIFKELDERPNRNDPTSRCVKAAKIQRLAERQGTIKATPMQWLQWADRHRFNVHDGFRMAVEALTTSDLSYSATAPIPAAVLRLPKQRAQEARILELILASGNNPKALPARALGMPGVKAEIRKLALAEPALFTPKTFDTAWQRVRDDGGIIGGD